MNNLTALISQVHRRGQKRIEMIEFALQFHTPVNQLKYFLLALTSNL